MTEESCRLLFGNARVLLFLASRANTSGSVSVVCERLDAAQTIAASINFALGGKASLQVSGISPNPPAPVSFRVCRLSWGGTEYPDGSEINVQKIEIFWPTEPTPKEAVDSCMANARKQFASDVKPGRFDGRGWEYGSHRFATDPNNFSND